MRVCGKSRNGVRKGGTNSSLIPTSLDVLQVVDFPDGSSYTINRKILSLVVEEDAATDATSEHRQVGKRAKTRAPSSENEGAAAEEESDKRSDSDYDEEEEREKEGEGEEERRHARVRAKARAPSKGKKRAAPAGGNKSKPAKKNKISTSACQVRSERNNAGAMGPRAHGLPTHHVVHQI